MEKQIKSENYFVAQCMHYLNFYSSSHICSIQRDIETATDDQLWFDKSSCKSTQNVLALNSLKMSYFFSIEDSISVMTIQNVVLYSAGPGQLLTVASYLQRECDRQSKRIVAEFSKCRHLEKIVQQVNEYMRSSNVYSKQTDKLDPKELDLLLGELTIMHSRAELYVRFIRRRVMVSHVIASSNNIISYVCS
jgi:COG4 transport protein.